MQKKIEHANEKIPCIEVLRACAVLLVLIHHINGDLLPGGGYRFYDYFKGWVGVDLFFAISGFVISRNLKLQFDLIASKRGYWLIVLEFWTKRAYRLLPSAWLWLIIILALAGYYNRAGLFGTVPTNVNATIAAILNFANFRLADAFGNYPYGASFVYWSLSLEEQFYLIFPFLMLLFRKWLPGFLLLAFALQVLIGKKVGDWSILFRTEAISLGIFLAFFEQSALYKKVEPKLMRNRLIALCVTIVLFALLALVPGKALDVSPYNYAVVAVISSALVWLASYGQNYIIPATFLSGALGYIGARSYAIYLIHIPAFYIVRETCFRFQLVIPGAAMIFVALILIFIMAELNYRLIEMPLRKRGAVISQRFRASKGGKYSALDPA